MNQHCRFCHEDLSRLPHEASYFRHTVGLCLPSRNDVDLAIRQLEIEDEREKEAIRAFWKRERERPGMFITAKQFLKFFGTVVLLGAGLILLCYGAVIVAAAWFGW